MSDITIRPARPGEVSALAALVTCSERASGGVRVLTADELADEGDGTTTTIEYDTRVVEIDGQLAGVAWVWHRRSDERLDRAYVFGEVAPELRRRGIGRALLDWGLARASARLNATGVDVPKFVRVDTDVRRADAIALFASRGLAPIRWFEDLLRPLDPPLDRVAPA